MSHCSLRGVFFLLLLILASCKTSDSWLPRQWHNTIAHYNTYFNAREKLRTTEQTSREAYTDRFDKVLELYNYGDESVLRNNGGAMDEILKKTSNLVDKHPKSKWVDDAYMLMAASYFLRGDFPASRELYQYIFSRFQDPVIKASSQIGVFRCLYMSGKLGEAESLISQLRNDKAFPKELRYDLDEAQAALYIRQEKYAAAAEPLRRLVQNTRNRTRRARVYFILAQVLQRSGSFNEAAANYARVVKLNPPYEMAFNAKINQVMALNSGKGGNIKVARNLLKQLLKDDKNFDYLDQIYFRLAETEIKDKNFAKAIEYYQLSLRNNKGNKVQMATSYLALADYFFDKQDFERSGYYYDSAVSAIPKESPDYNRISQKSMMLGELVRHLSTIREQDSLLTLAGNKPLLERTIDRLIAAEQERKQKEQQQQQNPAPMNLPNTGFQQDPGMGASAFPFYNAALRARGYNEFIRLWGQRDNRDYWRLKNMRVIADPNQSNTGNGDNTNDSANADIVANVPADRKKYYSAIPFSDKAKKDAGEKIAQAYFGAGNVYREKLLDCGQANKMYLKLLERFPKHALEPQVLFDLVKCYRLMGNEQAAATYEARLAADYPQSTYLNVLRQKPGRDSSGNNTAVSSSESSEVEQRYRSMYQYFKAGNYQKAMQEKLETDKKFGGNSLQAQFDYLYALCMGYSGQTEKAIVLMKAITSDYAGTPIAEQAAQVVLAWEKKNLGTESTPAESESSAFTWNNNDELFFLVIFQRGVDANKVRAALADYNNRNHPLKKLEVGRPTIAGDRYTLNITGFADKESLRTYLLQTREQSEWKQNAGADGDYFCCLISQSNYLLLLKNGQTGAYRKLFERSFR